MSGALILAADPGSAERAARWVEGDAVVHVGDPSQAPAGTVDVPCVVISGDLADHEWLSAAFRVAGRSLAAGGRVCVVVSSDAESAAPVDVALPPDVLAEWRVAGLSVEHPAVAVTFARAVGGDGGAASDARFRRALAASALYATGDPGMPGGFDIPVGGAGGDEDAEIARLRRELARYRNSFAGRLARAMWRLRSRVGTLLRRGGGRSSA